MTPHILRPHRNLAYVCDSRGVTTKTTVMTVRRSSCVRMRAAVVVTTFPWKRHTVLKSKFTQRREHEKNLLGPTWETDAISLKIVCGCVLPWWSLLFHGNGILF